MPAFVRAAGRIHELTADVDVVVNLLDLIGGASRLVYRSRVPAVAIAHNHLFTHPEIVDPPGSKLALRFLKLYTDLTAAATWTRVALSFVPMPAHPEGRLRVAPPLLRDGLDRLESHDGGYLLAYALNAGYGDLLREWQARRGDVTVHCYVDGGRSALAGPGGPGFHVHDLDQDAFLADLAGCRAYVGSAGFESLCEAYYLGKPVLAVPTEGQLEQTLNAWDATRCGVARAGTYEDLDSFWDELSAPTPERVAAFRRWVRGAGAVVLDAIEGAAGSRHGPLGRSEA
jgi:uncharacterized protein (TIGR00661 family)